MNITLITSFDKTKNDVFFVRREDNKFFLVGWLVGYDLYNALKPLEAVTVIIGLCILSE
jgi:hypothetical protein